MPDKTLAIVIPVWNNWSYTKKALKHLAELPKNHVVIIADNGSEDETRNLQSSKNVVVIHHKENLGFARGCNSGFAEAANLGYENVMFLNNDIKVMGNRDSWTAPLITAAKKGHIVGPTIGVLDANLQFVCESPKWPTRGFGYVSGWNITASTEVWNGLMLEGDQGPFSTNFFAYFEDTDLSFRALVKGIKFDIIPVPVKHLGRATGKKLNLSKIYHESRAKFLKLWEQRIEELPQRTD